MLLHQRRAALTLLHHHKVALMLHLRPKVVGTRLRLLKRVERMPLPHKTTHLRRVALTLLPLANNTLRRLLPAVHTLLHPGNSIHRHRPLPGRVLIGRRRVAHLRRRLVVRQGQELPLRRRLRLQQKRPSIVSE